MKVHFETGQRVRFQFIHPRPALARRISSKIEPVGRYMKTISVDEHVPAGWVKGTQTFESPLVMLAEGPGDGKHGSNSWKVRLSKGYGNKTGRDLSEAIVESGFDGIVTVSNDLKHTSDIVDLTSFVANGPRIRHRRSANAFVDSVAKTAAIEVPKASEVAAAQAAEKLRTVTAKATATGAATEAQVAEVQAAAVAYRKAAKGQALVAGQTDEGAEALAAPALDKEQAAGAAIAEAEEAVAVAQQALFDQAALGFRWVASPTEMRTRFQKRVWEMQKLQGFTGDELIQEVKDFRRALERVMADTVLAASNAATATMEDLIDEMAKAVKAQYGLGAKKSDISEFMDSPAGSRLAGRYDAQRRICIACGILDKADLEDRWEEFLVKRDIVLHDDIVKALKRIDKK